VKSPGAPPIQVLLSRRPRRKSGSAERSGETGVAVAQICADGAGDYSVWLAGQRGAKEFLGHFTVFALSCVVGYYVVWNVSHALHTPLMSVTNAISGIIVVGALLQIGHGGWVSFLSFIAVLIASINIFGGFTVTQRMLKMFRKG
jgi:NAD/NADP transhydrogenase alpha subunit